MVVQDAEVELRIRVTCLRRILVPPRGLCRIHVHALAGVAHRPEDVLRLGKAMLGGLPVPIHRLRYVPFHAQALPVAQRDPALRFRMPLGSRQPVEPRRFLLALLNALSGVEALCEPKLRVHVALLRSASKHRHHLLGVHPQAAAATAPQHAEIETRPGVMFLRSSPIPTLGLTQVPLHIRLVTVQHTEVKLRLHVVLAGRELEIAQRLVKVSVHAFAVVSKYRKVELSGRIFLLGRGPQPIQRLEGTLFHHHAPIEKEPQGNLGMRTARPRTLHEGLTTVPCVFVNDFRVDV
mmetsp:Transcript_22698/g.63336  ORF Transcript_22698/g.63336 Transcript_22698/m.63336 type:complete len:293 (+) Transcript_22698:501-1379(+)